MAAYMKERDAFGVTSCVCEAIMQDTKKQPPDQQGHMRPFPPSPGVFWGNERAVCRIGNGAAK